MGIADLNFKQQTKEMVKRTRMMYQLLNEIFEFYGCQHCSLCCKVFTPVIQEKEIKKISKHLKTKPKKFKRKYCNKLGIPFNEYELKAPCPFLDSHKKGPLNTCFIYPIRPAPCHMFPFELDPYDGIVRLVGIEVCPTATSIYNDFLDYHDRIKHLLPISKGDEEEIGKIVDDFEKMFKEQQEKIGVPESAQGIYAMVTIMQFYFFYLDRIAKVDDIEEQVKNYYDGQKVKK